MALRHPKTAYTGLQNSLQQDWSFVQNFTPGVREAFRPVEEALQQYSLTSPFRGDTNSIMERGATRLPIKQSGISIPSPTLYASKNSTE